MALVPLAIPPGVYRNGTEYQAAGRWHDANLVRWVDGAIKPVGGWDTRVAAGTKALRAAVAWRALDGSAYIAVAAHDKLYAISETDTVTDITPAGIAAGTLDAETMTGYGGWTYGTGFYGVERPSDGTYGEATTWALDNWGERLVACSNADGKIYEWDLNTSNDAAVIATAPEDNLSILVTDERFLFALGADGNPRQVMWSDREDNTVWTPAATNEAGSIELQTSGEIKCGVRIRGQALILTDLDAHVATYQGPPVVYGFERIGTACGIIARKAVAVVDDGAFWMGARGFFRCSGGAVAELRCEVVDYVFSDLNDAQLSKVYAVSNALHGEVWWFYPSAASLENDRYVAFNYKSGHWSIGEIERTCGIDQGIFSYPIWFDAAGQGYNHEYGWDHEGADVFAESGPLSIGNGDQVMSVVRLVPDENTLGDVSATFKTRFYPTDTEREYGPYTMRAPTSMRFTGRQVKMRVTGERLGDWRVGTMRLDAVARGLR